MKTAVFVGLLAIIGFATANCGCLKCSKHLRVLGNTIPAPGSAPTTVIFRGSPNSFEGQALPFRVEAPGPILEGPAEIEELKYKVFNPQKLVTEVIEPAGYKYDTKIEIPGPIETTATATTLNLKPRVDRIVLPGPFRGFGKKILDETVLVNPYGEGEVIVKETPPFNPHHHHHHHHEEIFVNPIRNPPVFINPIRNPPVFVNPLRPSCVTTCESPIVEPAQETIIKKFRY